MKHNPLFVWELLELILLHLDTRTLLISQRVCYLWSKVIRRSKRTQQALFLLPIKPNNVLHHERVRNPLLDEIVWPHVMQRKPDYPIFKGIFANVPIIKKSFRRKSASWRRMLIQQPPTSVLGVVELLTHQSRKKKETHHEQILVKPHSACLNLGALYDAVNKDFMQPCREKWVLSSGGPQGFLDEFLKDDRAPILDVAVKECDIVVVIWVAAVLIRGVDVKKTELELWLDEHLVDSPKYKPRRSGGVGSKYYGRGYSRM